MSARYNIEATYHVKKVMEVTVKDGGDPMNPADWEDIETEHDADCHLYDVDDATEIDEQGDKV